MNDLVTANKKSIFKKWWFWVGVVIVLSVIGPQLTAHQIRNQPQQQQPISKQSEEPTVVEVGQVLGTQYFDVKVNNVSINDRINTGNQFADLPPEQGILYLIINASFKNTDNESRMLTEGSVWINYNGKNYQYDKAETVMLDGWGLLLDQINPLTTKTTNLVFKIPTEVKGPVYWQPGRAGKNEVIFLGNIK